MTETLIVINNKVGSETAPASNDRWLHWKTCVREVAIGFGAEDISDITSSTSETFKGQDAYQFLLEVVCGLHSPLVGETEVMGQFKELVEKTPQSGFLPLFRSILTDAKLVRAKSLKNIGSRSYGSLLRRYSKESQMVSVIGAGKLAEEIIPWLKTAPQVFVKCRNLQKGRERFSKFSFVQVADLNSSVGFGDTIVIAAPLPGIEIREILAPYSFKRIVDFRESSSWDGIDLPTETINLATMFREIEGFQSEEKAKVTEAFEVVNKLASKWSQSVEIRPFGWEDLCG